MCRVYVAINECCILGPLRLSSTVVTPFPMTDLGASPQITRCSAADFPGMIEVWERSVRSSHDFLTHEQITDLRPQVPAALSSTELIYGIRGSDGAVVAFVGVTGEKLEMLFVDPNEQGKGYGKMLFAYAREALGATLVDVNEGNRAAIEFYEKLGAKRIGRSDVDDYGNPYPLLYYSI